MAKSKKTGLWWTLLLAPFLIIIGLFLYVASKGAINYNKLEGCKNIPDKIFCGIKRIDLSIPNLLKDQIIEEVNSGSGKRVVIPKWKAGRTIATKTVRENLPSLWAWYKSLVPRISQEIGEQVYITQEDLPTTCAILVYEEEGDFINWHYDVNYFKGRFFTLIIPVTFENTCTEYMYYDKNNEIDSLKSEYGKSILFEGDKTFHMASKYCNTGHKRVVVSVQFATDPSISFFNNMLMRIKDGAYIGVF